RASNNYALAARYSTTGHDLVEQDLHTAETTPTFATFAQVTVTGASGFSAFGVTAPGLPSLLSGYTAAGAAYALSFQLSDAVDVRTMPAGTTILEQRVEVLHVRGHPDQTITYRRTRLGWLLNDALPQLGPGSGAPLLALEEALADPSWTMAGFLTLPRARTLA